MRAQWIIPRWQQNTVVWPDPCQAINQTWDSSKKPCTDRAKLIVDGTPLCVMHAKVAALAILAGPKPDFTIKRVTDGE